MSYSIGTPNVAWQQTERDQWLTRQLVKRSYRDEVLVPLAELAARFTGCQYGALSIDQERYPLKSFVVEQAGADAPYVLITGGVHGYETSGVQGALSFVRDELANYINDFNFVICPCVSPWGYETINRWNPAAVDPNRSFIDDGPSEEANAVQALVARFRGKFLAHVDLHETTDTDESEFRPALAARDGKPYEAGEIPDGFYLVDDTEAPTPGFQAAMIAEVARVTHIAPPDANGQIIGSDVVAEGVIRYPLKQLGLCAGVTDATYRSTTEVYPDSDLATPEQCNAAQVASIVGALNYLKAL